VYIGISCSRPLGHLAGFQVQSRARSVQATLIRFLAQLPDFDTSIEQKQKAFHLRQTAITGHTESYVQLLRRLVEQLSQP
jgi:hypothetical protein